MSACQLCHRLQANTPPVSHSSNVNHTIDLCMPSGHFRTWQSDREPLEVYSRWTKKQQLQMCRSFSVHGARNGWANEANIIYIPMLRASDHSMGKGGMKEAAHLQFIPNILPSRSTVGYNSIHTVDNEPKISKGSTGRSRMVRAKFIHTVPAKCEANQCGRTKQKANRDRLPALRVLINISIIDGSPKRYWRWWEGPGKIDSHH